MSAPDGRPVGVVVGGFGLTQIAAFACSFYLMGVLGDAIGRDLGLSATFVFGTVSLSLAVPALISPRVAERIDRKGGKPVLVASHIALAWGLLMLGFAQDGLGLVVAMAMVGLGQALGLSPTPFAILVQLYGEAARRPMTGVALIGGLGSTLGWPITASLAETYGWRGACFAWAGVQLLACLPLTLLVCPRTQGHGVRAETAHGEVRWDRTMAQLAVLFACAWFVSTCMSAHLPRLLTAFGLTLKQASAAAGLVGVAAVSVRLLEFTVLRRFNPLATTRVATLMHPAGAAVLLSAGGSGAAAMALGQGAGNGMLAVAKGVLPLHLYGPANYAYRSALLGRPALVAQVFGPTVFAVALERSAGGAIVLTSTLCLVMFAMTFGLGRRPQSSQEPAIA